MINSTDPSGNVTHNEYDLAGQLTAVTLGYGTTNASRRTIAYDAADRKIGDTDARGNTTSYNYDEAGRMTSVLDPVGHLTTYSFDAAGNGISVTDSAGHTTQEQYDQRHRPFKTIYSDSTYEVRTFDGANRILTITDQAGAILRYAYDDAEQLLNVVQANSPDPQHNTTSYGYDQHGNLQTATDDNSHTTTSLFDFLERAMSQTLPAGGRASARGYDPAGNLVTSADYNGKTTAFAYDGFNRLLSKDPDPSLSEARVSFTYTSTGRRATMLDASGVTNYLYDHRKRIANPS